MENKNIDHLFQEKLKNLEATPTDKVWNNVASNLKTKKRRVLPIWWFSSGIAAILVVGLFIFPFSENVATDTNEQPIIIVAPEMNTEDVNTIKTAPYVTKEKIIIVEENKVPKKKPVLQKKRIVIADRILNNSEEEIKDTAGKNDLKTFLLTDQRIDESLKLNKKEIIAVQEKTVVTKKTTAINKNNKEVKNTKKAVLMAVENDVEEKENSTKKSWTVTPVVAVLSSNSFSNSSPLNKDLKNSTKGNNSYSYGVQIGYQLNKKWSVQSGFHLQEIQFSNNQIAVASTVSSTSNVVFNSGDNYSLNGTSSANFDLNKLSINAVSLDGNLAQEYGYLEIPVEIKYNLLESKRLKTEIVAGFSSLFLNKNSVNLNAGALSRTGKADNLNNLNFSGNLGFDFNYKLDKNWALHLNPMFKTQLNTYSKNANGFKPYFIGIYTGINYKF
ncbi:outer membrane beta-barrel protein [Polaribacter sp. IC073]|uniref:outer membrane beta-barrel protein n=1 Tax=Polaribacter sp. IC073 TaxID=2508540 RepID=UPI0011BDA96C|nr:outer membrane beta-barrel protein [Polaribacter sp. IC073]TXD49903.1 PorT family protein [Polaribacter sp. IC073]